MSAQPQQDARVQAIADRMAPIATKEGFAEEWALYGPALVQAHIDKHIANAKNLLEAAALDVLFTSDVGKKRLAAGIVESGLLEKSLNILLGPAIGQGHFTLRCDLATGQSTLVEAGGQGELASSSTPARAINWQLIEGYVDCSAISNKRFWRWRPRS